MNETFLEDFEVGKIQFRDKWQFELKSELYPFAKKKEGDLVQEFYFFIPNSLQVNDQTYPKAQFYQDQTNLIRFKTPTFSFKELLDSGNAESPLFRIGLFLDKQEMLPKLESEIKLFGSVFHTALRHWSSVMALKHDRNLIEEGIHELNQLLGHYRNLQKQAPEKVKGYFRYVDEYLSLTFNDYLLNLLEEMSASAPHIIVDAVLKEAEYREKYYPEEYPEGFGQEKRKEYLLYRKNLLNKFVIDPQLLKTSRASVDQRYRTIIGGIPAAIAMLVFLLFYVLQGSWFIINSEPFILFTVLIYVLKDRLKEELRFFSYRQVAKWFSDYATEIQVVKKESKNGSRIGTVREYTDFIEEKSIPSEILEIRNRHFHEVLEDIKRPERVLYYKKSINIKSKPETVEERFYGLNIFFRFDIHHFLAKAEDPFQTTLSLDEKTGQLTKIKWPRVYHLNIIMKSRKTLPDGTPKVEMTKCRLILDKTGIKRIEEM